MATNPSRFYSLPGLCVNEFLLILLLGCVQLLLLPYAEFLIDDAQTIVALRAITEDLHFPIFWMGGYPYLPHGTITAYLYLPLYLLWPSIYSPFLNNIFLNGLTALLLIQIGEKLRSRDAGLVAALFFMLHPTFVGFYSQSIWNVTGIFFLSTLCLHRLLAYFEAPSTSKVIGASIVLSLIPYTHVLGFLYYPAFFLIIMNQPRRQFWSAWIIAFLMALPYFIFLVEEKQVSERMLYSILFSPLLATFFLRLRTARRLSINITHAFLICGAVIAAYIAISHPSSPLDPLLRILDSVHSYNISNRYWLLESLRLSFKLERLLWISAVIYGLVNFRSLSKLHRAVYIFSLAPVVIFIFVSLLSHDGFGVTHHRWILLFPMQFLLIGTALVSLHSYNRYFRGLQIVALLYLLVSVGFFADEVSHHGRPTLNNAMVGERQVVSKFLNDKLSCRAVYLVQGAGTGKNNAVTWGYFITNSPSDLSACEFVSEIFYVSIRGIKGWSAQLEETVSNGSQLVFSGGRIKIFLANTDLQIGQKIYPRDPECKEALPIVHGFAAVQPPRCSVR